MRIWPRTWRTRMRYTVFIDDQTAHTFTCNNILKESVDQDMNYIMKEIGSWVGRSHSALAA